MNQSSCQCVCEREDCSRFHKPPRPPCNCIRHLSKSTKFIERVIDICDTVVRVLSICGIHECKAKAAGDVLMFGFLHYNIVQDPVNDCLRKKLRKEDLFHDFGRKCRMNRIEAHMGYQVMKRAFKAFYYKQTADSYNLDFFDEDQWMRAAEKTAEVYSNIENMKEPERRKLEKRIKTAYCGFIRRAQDAQKREAQKNCTCLFCKECQILDGKNFKLFSSVLPKEEAAALQYKQRLIDEGRKAALEEPDLCGHKALEWLDKQKQIERCCICHKTPCACSELDFKNCYKCQSQPEGCEEVCTICKVVPCTCEGKQDGA